MSDFPIDILQVLWYDDLKFYPDFVNMFQNKIIPHSKLNIKFVTPYKDVYQALKEYPCVTFCAETEILELFKQSRWIFLHPLSLGKIRTILIKKSIANRIIWRTWGHDIRLLKHNDLLHRVIFNVYVKKVRQFHAIGVDNPIDCENVEKVFGSGIDTVQLNYSGLNDQYYQLKEIDKEPKCERKTFKVMIGHNGGDGDNHFELIDLMEKYKNENVCFSFPLSYGNKDRIKEIKKYAISHLGEDKCEFIEDFMPFSDYARYIKNVDVALMDQEYSNALGNITLLIYFKRKLYINENGDFARSFKKRNLVINYTSEIRKQTFSQFVHQDSFDDGYLEYIKHYPLTEIDAALNGWCAYINKLMGFEAVVLNRDV